MKNYDNGFKKTTLIEIKTKRKRKNRTNTLLIKHIELRKQHGLYCSSKKFLFTLIPKNTTRSYQH